MTNQPVPFPENLPFDIQHRDTNEMSIRFWAIPVSLRHGDSWVLRVSIHYCIETNRWSIYPIVDFFSTDPIEFYYGNCTVDMESMCQKINELLNN